ncbi:MAG: Glutamate 5-kinase [Candidatus Moanabacter tarae]|uniref:Glutamate 5-kinase n=1 Tax=Candidatus Moanibacter tarae TaxID=2200854 RepID=A0A2Z4AMX8_9BACT|nr:MAG: Glutamate 5-kinase [Candidatus Moanabacter tarae]|tara:strand:+ start:51845 stop:52951 length:1107 start_codon:yes stop_codon:yes gene_type:complete
MHFLFENADRAVIKLGSNLLTDGSGSSNTQRIAAICRQIHLLHDKGIQVIIVSSGAIGLGMGKLGYKRRPRDLASLQACAAVGQSILTDTWQAGFDPFSIVVAQVLLTREDVRSRKRHVAVKNLFERLLSDHIVPIVNENDSVSTDEIRFGENDVLSALVSSLTKTDILIILSVIPGLIDREGSGKTIPLVENFTPYIEKIAGDTDSTTSVGGMRSKIKAAKIAVKSGCAVFIGDGNDPDIIKHLFRGNANGTFFMPNKIPLASRKRWIAFFENSKGSVTIDRGAHVAVTTEGRSLLARGIIGYRGEFEAGDVVKIESADGVVIARGVCQYASVELDAVLGQSSKQIHEIYPDRARFEVVHRDSLVIL